MSLAPDPTCTFKNKVDKVDKSDKVSNSKGLKVSTFSTLLAKRVDIVRMKPDIWSRKSKTNRIWTKC